METPKIITITASANGAIYGLGEDMKVYRWNTAKKAWELYDAGY